MHEKLKYLIPFAPYAVLSKVELSAIGCLEDIVSALFVCWSFEK